MMEVKSVDAVIHFPACTSIKVMAIKLPVHRVFILHFKILKIFWIIYYVIKNEYLGNGSESKTLVLVGMVSL